MWTTLSLAAVYKTHTSYFKADYGSGKGSDNIENTIKKHKSTQGCYQEREGRAGIVPDYHENKKSITN